jgi:hypothetical protein
MLNDAFRLRMMTCDAIDAINEHCEPYGVTVSHDPDASPVFYVTTPTGKARVLTLGAAIRAALIACVDPNIGPGIFICTMDHGWT